jgi:hypothetical protein
MQPFKDIGEWLARRTLRKYGLPYFRLCQLVSRGNSIIFPMTAILIFLIALGQNPRLSEWLVILATIIMFLGGAIIAHYVACYDIDEDG